MKKLMISALLLLGGINILSAQSNCETLVLPYFHYDTAQMATYPAAKMAYRCAYAQAAFYESDTIPTGAILHDISEVREAYGTNYLPQTFVVDLNTLSYYAYNFKSFQLQFTECDKVICFSTPSSTHPYLVMRSLVEMGQRADEVYMRFHE